MCFSFGVSKLLHFETFFFLQASIQQLPGQGAQLESSRDAKDELSFQVFDSFPGPKIPDSKFGHWFRISL